MITFQYVKESIIDDLIDGPIPEFQNEAEDEIAWDELQKSIYMFLLRYSHDEESEDAPDGPGFLIQDIADGTWTVGIEMNDHRLISKEVFEGIADILTKESPSAETRVLLTTYHKESMYFTIVQRHTAIIPNIRSMKNLLK